MCNNSKKGVLPKISMTLWNGFLDELEFNFAEDPTPPFFSYAEFQLFFISFFLLN